MWFSEGLRTPRLPQPFISYVLPRAKTGGEMADTKSQVGDTNRNGQRLIEKTNIPGNDHLHYTWVLECQQVDYHGEQCGHQYGANGTDYFERKCPQCQGGKVGLPIP